MVGFIQGRGTMKNDGANEFRVWISAADFFWRYITMGMGWRQGLLVSLACPRCGNNLELLRNRIKGPRCTSIGVKSFDLQTLKLF